MKPLQNIFNFYINSSIHVALAVYALTWITLIEYGFEYDKELLYFVFFATITGYNFIKYFGVAKFHHRSLAKWLKIIQLFSLGCFLLMLYYAFALGVRTIIIIAIFGGITFLYAIPMLPKHILLDQQQNLREIGGLKIYVIAFVWAGVTVLLPILHLETQITVDVSISIIQRFLLVLVLMLPFEIRDLKYDSLKLATIPQKIGIKKTKAIGALVLIIFFNLEFFKDEMQISFIVSTLILVFFLLLFLIFSNKNQSKYYSAFWVESLPVFWLMILLLLH
ncbi:UbiA prenyltransferase family protein [Winogradskyella immobilis]|uniref:Prenyltransferase n=1 Tax=Winogradskyella immobilis TaxID=2816852 RepID=A0ABS8ENF6_9FLAO|nr:hypothetical protein [Winogradskyella immobilis]MCC1484739.1 hypothetical protein [Winogradskyella immobilis]MCG0016831.1 hypothetical protein [Winogradskyella immobilis]